MARTVSYKDARNLAQGDTVIFPNDVVRKIAGKINKPDGFTYFTCFGGFEGRIDSNFRMKLLGNSVVNGKAELPDYIKQ